MPLILTFMASSVNSLTLNLVAASWALDTVGFEMMTGMAFGLGRGGEKRGDREKRRTTDQQSLISTKAAQSYHPAP